MTQIIIIAIVVVIALPGVVGIYGFVRDEMPVDGPAKHILAALLTALVLGVMLSLASQVLDRPDPTWNLWP